jgi:pimeloyl-ACP methyl ester carboxylesterase
MKKQHSLLFLAMTSLALGGCANPAAAVKSEALEFKEKFPDHVLKLESRNRELQYAWSGDPLKRPLLFVHGSPGSWEGWAHFLLDPSLKENFQVIAVDRPGFGGSNPGESERSLQKQADLIIEVLKINKSGLPAILVGHSYGGPVVAKMAMSYPKQVAGVIFVASSVAPDLEKTKWYQYPADWWPIRDLIPSPLKVCNQEIFALKDELKAMMPLWKTFSAKVVTIQGEDDDLVPVGNQDFLLTMLDPKLIVKVDRIEGLNHFIPWKRPDLILNGISAMADAIKKETP